MHDSREHAIGVAVAIRRSADRDGGAVGQRIGQ
jgi:hypothetical protein